MLKPGQPAPVFVADSTKGRIELSESLGKRPIVLIFYPKDETPICTKQLCAVRDSERSYAELGAAVYGINPGSLEKHAAFAAKFQYDFPLIVDTDFSINQLYDVGRAFLLPGQKRIVYAIGADGRIVYARKGNPPTREILDALKGDRQTP